MDELINSKQFNANQERFSFRTITIFPVLLFISAVALNHIFFSAPMVANAIGVIFHMLMIFVVNRLPAPQWAKAAGYCWVALDITSGAMSLNNIPPDIALSVRLGGHVLAAMWIVSSSLLRKPLIIKTLGIVEGLWLALYTFFGSVLPISVLMPASILIVVWLVILGYKYPTTPQEGN